MNETPKPANDAFIERLVKICADRGSNAALRRFWSPATRHYAYPILGRLSVADPRRPDAITAALYAINPNHATGGLSVGKACLKLAGGSMKADGFESFERHMRRLLASDDLVETGDQLYRVFKRMERKGISLDFNKLLWDLRNWAKKSEDVKTRWAMDFWQAPAEQNQTETAGV
jgi:CRISPR system Cascade subunit CasB